MTHLAKLQGLNESLANQLAEMTKRAEAAEASAEDLLTRLRVVVGGDIDWTRGDCFDVIRERLSQLATVTAERDKMRPIVEAARVVNATTFGGYSALAVAPRALDAAPPEEAKRCPWDVLPGGCCTAPGCPVHGASRPGQGQPDTTPDPTDDKRVVGSIGRSRDRDPYAPSSPVGFCDACGKDFSHEDHGNPITVGGAAHSFVPVTPHPAVATGTGRCARCGMFADELPHSEAFAHRHDFVPMTDAPQLRAALVAAHARIAALESEAAAVATRHREGDRLKTRDDLNAAWSSWIDDIEHSSIKATTSDGGFRSFA